MKLMLPLLGGLLLVFTAIVLLSACGVGSGKAKPAASAGDSATEAPAPRAPGEILPTGIQAPVFNAVDDTGQPVNMADYLGKTRLVLVFYPKDNTPGCTAQLCAVRDDWKLFQRKNVVVFGVSSGSQDSSSGFRERYNFPFPLLLDKDSQIAALYGSEGYLGMPKRTVYGIDETGRIVFAERGMPSNSEILGAFEATIE